jgi:hypothetical protein
MGTRPRTPTPPLTDEAFAELERWTNEQLDLVYEPTAEAIALEVASTTPENLRKFQELYGPTWTRVRLNIAIQKDDVAGVERIAGDDPELLRFAIRSALHKNRRGHPEGGRKDEVFEDLLAEAELIKQIWKRHQRKVHRPKETACRIAIKRALKLIDGAGAEDLLGELINWEKNRGHRIKSPK